MYHSVALEISSEIRYDLGLRYFRVIKASYRDNPPITKDIANSGVSALTYYKVRING